MYKVYLYANDLNDATAYYIDILMYALKCNNEEVVVTSILDEIEPLDKVIVMQARAFVDVWRRNRKQYCILWFQGILPEEVMLTSGNFFRKIARRAFWTILEMLALKYAKKIFFVSNQMLEHYKKKYRYSKDNYFIMPCFNQRLNPASFTSAKYEKPAFVYAGSMSKWQCVDTTLLLFKEIKKRLPHASLTLLTKEDKKARKLLMKYDLVDVEIKYVPYQQLETELINYKYGFLLREDIEVNRVATPTKMNSYMANGIIPVYSDVIGDFKQVFRGRKYIVTVTTDMEMVISSIIELEKRCINPADVLVEYTDLFSTYYSREYYEQKVRQFFLD